MEELLELKALLLKGDIKGSLAIVEDLEDMSKNGIISTIRSYAVILLLHLIIAFLIHTRYIPEPEQLNQ